MSRVMARVGRSVAHSGDAGLLRARRLCGVGIAAARCARTGRKPPALGPPPQLTLPPIQKRTLSNGLPVWMIEAHEVPLVQVNLLVLAGSGDDPAGQVRRRQPDGGDARRRRRHARARSRLPTRSTSSAPSLATSSSFDASAVRLNVPVARLADALPIMADVALRPTFPQKELDRLRQERITALLQARDDPASVAPMAFARRRLRRHASLRHGGDAAPTATLKAFTAADLRAFHAAMYQPSNATLVVVGDVRADAMLPLLEKHFGAWSRPRPVHTDAGRRPRRSSPSARSRSSTCRRPQQSQIRIGWVGVARSTPDYFTLQVLNTILGGSFTSRLNQNLREKNGYTYGASSRFDMRLSPGAVRRRRRRADRQDVRGAARVLQRAERHRQAGRRRGADEGEELRRARVPERIRDDRATSRRTSRS